MIKVKLMHRNHDQIKYINKPIIRNLCRDNGIDMVDGGDHDILLLHTDGLNKESKSKLIKSGKPIIFRNVNENFKGRYASRRHCSIILDSQKIEHPKTFIGDIDISHLNKLALPVSYAHCGCTNNSIKQELNVTKNRAIDVHFCGTVGYERPNHKQSLTPITNHRKKAIQAIRGLKVRCTKDVSSSRKHVNNNYFDTIYNTKIIVSPWGCGEVCYRDFEALAAGCILIKPNTNFVESWPDIFNKRHYIACRPDFSDLNEKVTWVLSHWKSLQDMRLGNRKLLEDVRQPKVLADRVSELINTASTRIR